MPDQPKPEGAKPEVLTRTQAQFKLGLFAPHDFVTIGLIFFSWLTLGFWKLFGTPSTTALIAFAVVNLSFMQVWSIVLAYRALVFILDLHSDVALMPESSARIALGYFEGRKPSK